MGLFKKKKKEEDEITETPEEDEEEAPASSEQPVEIQLAKLGAKVEGLSSIRKSFSERFAIISEQIGELRGMILDANKQIQTIEIDSTKTIEMVKEVQPDKFMTMLRKQEGQLEGVKASLEGKDAIMKDITQDLTKIRKQMSFYRGIEQVQKLNDEIKKDLFAIKKVQAIVEQHSDKVESMFIDLQKRYGDMDGLTKSVRAIEEVLGELKKKIETQGFELEKKSRQAELDELKKRFDIFASSSKIENLKEFGEQLDNMMKTATESLTDIQSSNRKVDEIQAVIDQTNLPQLALNVKRMDKLSSLMEVDINRNKEILDTLKEDHEHLGNVQSLLEDNTNTKKTIVSLEQAIGGLLNKIVSLSQEKANANSVKSIDEEQKSQYEHTRKLQQELDNLRKTVDNIESEKISPEKIKKMEESEDRKDVVIKELIGHQDEAYEKIDSLEKHIKEIKALVRGTVQRSAAPAKQVSALKLVNGSLVTSIDDLAIKLRIMSDKVFLYHVNSNKNDIADWIHSELGQKALAKVLRGKRTKKDALGVINAFSKMFN